MANIWTNKELEVKILWVDFDSISEKITEIWWVLEFFRTRFEAVWMKNSEWKKFRIRKEWDKVKVEHKEMVPNWDWLKEAIETWFSSDNFEWTINFFEKIWFKEISRDVKNRTSFILKNMWDWETRIVIDEDSNLWWLNIPTFIEIEAFSKEVILEVARLLWFDERDFRDWWAEDLIKFYWKS